MADSDKNILITPNRSQAAQPSIAFTGKGNVPITLRVLDDSNGTLSFEGSAGQLFSINNNLSTGTIFSVNDVSGIPMIDVDASGIVRLAPLGGTVYSNTLYSVPKTVAGSGNSLTLVAGDGVTSGAGGNIVLKPGIQATTGGNGYVQIKSNSGTTTLKLTESQYNRSVTLYMDYYSAGLTFDAGIVGMNLPCGMFMLSGGGIRARNYIYTGFGSSNSNNNDNFGYLYMRTDGIITWAGAVGFAYGSVGQLKVTDASTGGGSLAYTSSTPTALSINTDNLVLTGSAFQRLSSSAAYNLTGIAPPASGAHVDGRVIWLHNVGSFNITLKHNQTSTAANQFLNENGGDMVLGPGRILQCTYDSTSSRWRVHGEMYPYNFPTTDGTSGQVLSTNGSGTLSWANASSGTGTVTSVSGTGTVNGITLTGTVTSTGNLTLGGSLSNVSLTSQVTGTLPIANGGTNATTALAANANTTDWGQLINHNTITDFNAVQRWGCAFVTGTTNGPTFNTASQYYQMMLSLGGNYNWGGSAYAMQMAIPRNVSTPYIAIRYKEGGADTAGWGSWQKISAGYADTAGSATGATNATNVAVTADSTNATRYISFVGATSGNNGTLVNSALSYIPASGNLGIGTSSPANQLHLHASEPRIQLTTSAGGSTYSDGSWIGMDATGLYFIERESSSIRFITNSTTEAARITSAGNIGIGNTSPGAKLQVDTGAAGTKGLIVKAAASQTANFLELQNSSGTNLVAVDSTGELILGSGVPAVPSVTTAKLWIAAGTQNPGAVSAAGTTAMMVAGGNIFVCGDGTLSDQAAVIFRGADGAGSKARFLFVGDSSVKNSSITSIVDTQGQSGHLAFDTAPSAATGLQERMRITSAGNVGIGTTLPNKLLTIAGNAATPQITIYKSPDGSINSAQQVAVLGTGSSNSNSGTTGGNEFGLLQLFNNGTVRCQIYAGGNGWILDGMSFGSNSAPPGQVYITPTANTTRGLVVRGAASQSANLQEWQNSGGTAVATVDASGNFSANNYSSTTASSTTLLQTYSKEYSFYRAAPTVVGNYVEICDYNEVTGFMEITVASESGGGIGHTIKRYHLAAVFAQTRNVIISPICIDRQSGYTSTFDFELESASISSYTNRLRIRRTAGTSARNLVVTIKLYSPYSHTLTSQTGTGTSSIGNSFWNSLIGTYLAPPPVVGGSGAGNNLTLYGGSGETSGAGGSIILQPGAQASTGGNGSIRFVNPSNTGQYLTLSVSSTQAVIGLTGITDASNNIQINHNVYLPGKKITCSSADVSTFTMYSGMLRAANGASVQFGSSNGTSTDNINYIWMRQDGHIAWYGDIGLRRDGVGVLSVTNGSTGGGSLAYKSNTTNISTATNNLVLNGSAFQRLNCTAACNLTGIAPPSGSHIDGRMMRIYNVGTANLTLKHNSTSSDIANRFCCIQAVDIILAPRDYAELIYDGTDGGLVAGQNNPCWRVA